MKTSAPADGSRVYDGEGDLLGTVHESARSGRWFFKQARDVSPARYATADDAARALRAATRVWPR